MANNLYIFAIGGTGVRVLKSFIMLLAAGVKIDNYHQVVPIIIDPDVDNADLNDTIELINLYNRIRLGIHKPEFFFSQELKSLYSLINKVDKDDFILDLNIDKGTKFIDYLNYYQIPEEGNHRKIVDFLYSDKELKLDLTVGFKGHPNIGVVVLNQLFENELVVNLINKLIEDKDGIFIVNSVFGGTGASGFPLLVQTLRDKFPKFTDKEVGLDAKDIQIGGLSMLPYFKINEEPEEADIKSYTFDEKEKLALEYYKDKLLDKLDALYMIGSKGEDRPFYDYYEGGKRQHNPANFLELIGALSILDFAAGKYKSENYLRLYAIKGGDNNDSIIFDNLNEETNKIILEPLVRFKFFIEYLNNALEKATKDNVAWLSKLDFENSIPYNKLMEFAKKFNKWIDEMAENQPKFVPFNKVEYKNALSLVNGQEIKGLLKNTSFNIFDKQNNNAIKDISDKMENETLSKNSEKDFTILNKLFEQSTKEIFNKYYKK